jgi:ElaB/YqjD/DUF883 family membrane-anchored ribosome-binding protein
MTSKDVEGGKMKTQQTYPDAVLPTADVHSARERLEAAIPELPEMKAKLQKVAADGKTHVTEWKGSLEAHISERPVQSLLIATGVGAFLGMMFGRRSH